jgi:hypothetical protein
VAEFGVPDSYGARILDVGTRPFLDYFEREVLDTIVANGGATCRFFEGQYGTGKTHLVLLLEDLGRRRGMAVVRADLSAALALEDWQLITQHVLANLELHLNGRLSRGLPQILDLIQEAGTAATERLAQAKLPHSGFQNAMKLAISGKLIGYEQEFLDRYVLGERVGHGVLRAHHIRNPLSRRNAEYVLKTVLAGLFHLGVPGVLVIFDENERSLRAATSRPPRAMANAANLIRRLIDGTANGTLVGSAVVFAVVNGFVANLSMSYPALAQRLWFSRDGLSPSWRSPVLQLRNVCAVVEREAFLIAASERFTELVQPIAPRQNVSQRLGSAGRAALDHSAGLEFKRSIMKALASVALQCIEEGSRGA